MAKGAGPFIPLSLNYYGQKENTEKRETFPF